jgi:hypothetical protein
LRDELAARFIQEYTCLRRYFPSKCLPAGLWKVLRISTRLSPPQKHKQHIIPENSYGNQ